jgi:hypothetical protein
MDPETFRHYHQYQGNTNDCAPHTVAMVVNALKGQQLLKGDEVAKAMNKPRLQFGLLPLIRRIPNWATFPWGVVDEFRQHGVKARWRTGATVDDLRRALAEDRIPMPIIGEIKFGKSWAHIKPLAEIDPERGFGFIDPASTSAETWQKPDEFERLWANYWHLLVETL